MSESDFLEIADALAPGRDDLVTVIQAYFDESYGPDGLLCVAGYVFTKAGARGLTREWGHMLRRWKLPYFRMSACAHGNEPFDRLSADARDKVARAAIGMTVKYAAFGVANTVNEHEFNAKVPDGDQIGNARAYEFLTWNCLLGVRQYCDEARFKGKVAYFFEAGHKSQTSANNLMGRLFTVPTLRAEYRYAAHGFIGKEDSIPIQTADLLAWQFYQDRRREIAGKPRRKDMQALLNLQCIVRHVDVDRHAQAVRDTMAEIAASDAASRSSP
ncbi:MAG: hypothetical protein NW206_07670 [Hyphomonadaceae bacterium]|nr:hypothetical protein [Hyphomonadaceae bacterium]